MLEQVSTSDIAIVGMTGRFPGAKNLNEFWANICAKKETIASFSEEELLSLGVDPLTLRNPHFVKAAANLADVADFDASFFGIHPRDAEIMDPQQRILLECAWEALESAGYASVDAETVVSVFVGTAVNTYLLSNLLAHPEVFQKLDQLQVNINNAPDFLATRISYKLNLTGPSLTVQTACSTSLVAVHLACQSLLDEECDLALAGGISINLKQATGYMYQPEGITSPDGHCRPFDAQARGTVFGSGVGVVVLKRLGEALRDGDTIHAVIKGSAINNDGAGKVGYTAPSVEGQSALITETQILANVEAETISYVEAHGTGTALGDPIEVEALTRAFRRQTQARQFCALGSVKGNIGHLDAAAGIAGLLKTVLALKHAQLPPNLHYQQANPAIDFASSPFAVNTALRPWPRGNTPRRAAVSSFGIGGTNAHVIVEEAPERMPSGPSRPCHLLLYSARSAPGLERQREQLRGYLAESEEPLADVAYTLQVGRKAFGVREAVLCRGRAQGLERLAGAASERLDGSRGGGEPRERRVAWLFPGQGAQYVQMGRDLYEQEAVFRREVDACAEQVQALLGQDLRAVLYPREQDEEEARGQLRQTRLAQPALFVVSYALAQLLLDWGLEPDAMIGHSVGEYVAASLAGVMEVEEALRLLVERAELMQRQPAGGMLAVSLSEEEAREVAERVGVAVAAVNGPGSCVLAGSRADLERAEVLLSQQGRQCQRLETSHAFHSEMMEAVVAPLTEAARRVSLQEPRRRYLSTVSGDWISREQVKEPEYWGRQVREPVRFAAAVERLREGGEWVCVEVGPGRGLSTQVSRQMGRAGIALLGGRGQREVEGVLEGLGKVWVQGGTVRWERYWRGEERRRVELPTYPFERQRFWISPAVQSVPLSVENTDRYISATEKNNPDDRSEAREVASVMALSTAKPQTESSRWTTILATLKTILANVIGLDASSIDPQLSLLELGVDSLLLLQVNQAVKDTFDITLTLRQFLEELTNLELLARYIDQQLPPEVFQSASEPEPRAEAISTVPSSVGSFSSQQSGKTEQGVRERKDAQAVSAPAWEAFPVGTSSLVPGIEGLMSQHLQIMSQMLELMRHQGNGKIPAAASLPPVAASPAALPGETDASSAQKLVASGNGAYIPYQPIRLDQVENMGTRQQSYLRAFIARYTSRTPGSKRMIQDYRAVLSNNRNSAGFRLSLKELVYPIVVDKAAGSHIIDIDGNEYIDISMGFGAYLFGHNPAFIASALQDEMARGMAIGPFSDKAGEVASLIAQLTGVERVAFFNTGTEAVMVALRLARAVTGRAKIALFAGSFHGAFDGTLARAHTRFQGERSVPLAPGIPEHMADNVLVLDYGNPESLEIIRKHSSELAAVLVEPVQSRRPDFQPGDFLRDLRSVTREIGIALIFDEIITGFRTHPGGAQAWFDVTADIVTYGKVVGGGMPIGIVAGKAEYLDSIDGGTWSFGDDSYPKGEEKRTFVAGTFCQHPLAMGAALAVLHQLQIQGSRLQQELNQRTAALAGTLNAYFQAEGAPIKVVHFGSLFRFVLRGDLELFYYLLNYKGVYLWEGRNCFLSTAHSSEDIHRLIQIVKETVTELQDGGFLPPPPGQRASTLPSAVPALPQEYAVAMPDTNGHTPSRSEESTTTSRANLPQLADEARPLQFSLSYFGKYDADFRADKYDLLFAGAKFADENGFTAVWVPERHFHPFGGLSPHPSILAAALARETRHVQIRAGSVVLPLHNPVLVTEEWAMIDNLSQGRVGVSFASGWQADDFVLAPQAYQNRRSLMSEGIEQVHKLWQGQSLRLLGGTGKEVDIKIYPQPSQPMLPTWLTAVKNPATYQQAGRLGCGILTNLMDQTVDELAANIKLYRQTLQEHGYSQERGHVTLLMHTFLGSDQVYARETARQPFYEYIRSFLGLVRNQARNQPVAINVDQIADEDVEHLLSTAYARYLDMSALIGTPEACLPVLQHLSCIGVDEVACFIDFGVDAPQVLRGLDHLLELRQLYNASLQEDSPSRTGTEQTSPVRMAGSTGLERVPFVALTPEQKQLWFQAHLSSESSSLYNEGVLLQINGPLNVEALRYALQAVIQRHEALRTTLSEDGEGQFIWPSIVLAFPTLDFSDVAADLKHHTLEEWLKKESRQSFDLLRGPLVRATLIKMEQENHFLALLVHHIVADDWSRSVLLQEVAAIYSARCAGSDYDLGPVTQFREFVAWQAKQVDSDEYKLNEAFWRKQCATPVPALALPGDYWPGAQKVAAGARERFVVGADLYQELRRLALSQQSTLFMLLLAAFKIFLHRLTGQNELVVGIPTAGQPLMKAVSLVGQCINVLPVRTAMTNSDTFAGVLSKVKTALLDLYDHQNYSLARLEQTSAEGGVYVPGINVLFNMDRAISLPEFSRLSTQLHPYPLNFARFDLSLNVSEISGSLQLDFEYAANLFAPETMRCWASYFENLLHSLFQQAAIPVWQLPLMLPSDLRQVASPQDVPQERSVPDPLVTRLFEERVERAGNSLALVTKQKSISYRELNQRANELAHYFLEQGLGQGTRVGILLDEPVDLVVSALAILKIGGTYVWSPSSAEEMLYILGEGQRPAALITLKKSELPFSVEGVHIVYLNARVLSRRSKENPTVDINGQTALYTNCEVTAGEPRTNFALSYERVGGYCLDIAEQFQLHEGTTFWLTRTQGSELMFSRILPCLLTGATLRWEQPSEEGTNYYCMLREHPADIIDVSLFAWRRFLKQVPPEPVGASSLPVLVVVDNLNIFQSDLSRWSESSLKAVDVLYAYRPARTPITLTFFRASTPAHNESLLRRVALTCVSPECRFSVLGALQQPAAVNIPGPLFCNAGKLGHLPGEQIQPFEERGGGPALFSTGDIARVLADGRLEFCGFQTVDSREKMSDLALSEALLWHHPELAEVAVCVRQRSQEDAAVATAYVVPQPASSLTPQHLQSYLLDLLPAQFIPAAWMFVEHIPTSSAGVIAALLPNPPVSRSEHVVGPRTPLEEDLVQLWRTTLNSGDREISVYDSFFESGGHSLSATQLVSRISEKFKVRLTLRTLFEAPTIAGLALQIAAQLEKKDAQENNTELFPMIVPHPDQRYQPFPLTDVQQAYWIGRQGAFGLGDIATHAYYEVESEHLDIDRLCYAWNQLIARHEMLRAIVLPDGQQCILQSVPLYSIELLDLQEKTPDEAAQELEALRSRMSHQILPSDRWPLFEIRAARLLGGRTRLFVSIDALIMDAWSMQILFSELDALYRDSAAPLRALSLSFADYVRAQVALEETQMYKRAESYWQDRLATLPPAPDIPLVKDPAALMHPRFVRWGGRLEPATWQRLKDLSTRSGLTPSIILLTAYAEVLTLWSKNPCFTINLTLFNRLPLHPEVNDIVGDFTSVTLLAIDNGKTQPFVALARQLQAQLWEDLDHRYHGGVRVLRDLARKQRTLSGVLMPVVFTSSLIHDADDVTTSPMQWLGDVVYSVTQTPQVWLDHEVFEDAGSLVFTWDVVEELFPPGLIASMFSAFEKILLALAEDEALWQEDWPVLAASMYPREQRLLRENINATSAPIDAELLQAPFLRQAGQTPERLAVVTSHTSLTYGDVYERANQLGRKLRQLGARPNTLIAVCMEKGWEQIVGVLAVLISGAAYVPVDPELPEERLNYILEQTQAELLLTQSWLQERVRGRDGIYSIAVDTEDLAAISAEPLEVLQQPEDLAYVIFTSGSTGQPKGVAIEHRGAMNTIQDINQRFAVTAQDRILSLSSLSFDLSVYDVFGLLAVGGTIVLPDAWALRDPAHWSELMRKNGVTLWNTVPALMDMLVTYADGRSAILPETLRLVMLSGDWIPIALPDRTRSLVPDVQIISLGGATEASIWSILYPIGEVDLDWKSIPYGKPMANQTFYVLNHVLEPCPSWIPGQLYIGGIGLARGYWRDEEKTRASFVVHPRTGQRLYKTGDLGRYLPDGNIEFLGREDFQVKVQGYRIELGEIQTILDQHPGIRAGVVAAVGEQRENKRLVAYIVPEGAVDQESGAPPENSLLPPAPINGPLNLLKFKLRQPNLRWFAGHKKIPLACAARQQEHWETLYFQRRSHRQFFSETISFEDFSAFLSCLAQLEIEGSVFPKYRYSSAGSLYPVQTYLALKPGRIEGLSGGFYYYQPKEHCLVLLTQVPLEYRKVYDLSSRSLVEQSAFSIFFVGQENAIRPIYPEASRHFMTIEAGLMSQLLETTAPLHGIGLCQTGMLDFASVRENLLLEEGHVFLHGLVGGTIDRQQSGLASFLEDNREYETLVRMLPVEEQAGYQPESQERRKTTLVQEVMEALKKNLPAYMVPSNIVVMDALPLTENGKVDRKALPIPSSEAIREVDASMAPETELQKKIVALIQEVLHIEKVGVNESFFELGGTSVHLIQFHVQLQKAIGRDIPIVELFKYTTVNELALRLSQAQIQEEDDREVAINEGKNRLKRLLKKSGDERE